MSGKTLITNVLTKVNDFFEVRGIVLENGGLQEGIDGSSTVYTEGGAGVGQSFNREAPADPVTATPAKFTWPAGSRPTKINVILEGCTVGESVLWVVFDAPDDATAIAWLAGATGEAVDSQRFVVLPASVVGTESVGSPGGKEFNFTDGLSRMDYRLEANDATAKLYVEAS